MRQMRRNLQVWRYRKILRREGKNMKQFRLNIDGKEVFGLPGQTILEVAVENDIFIPTLCFDERTEIYGACGMCICEQEGNPKLVKACATEISSNMVIFTNTDRVLESRKTNLELLLSNHVGDCRPPCTLACPGQTDCQGYVGLIANGEFEAAIELIRGKIPLPGSIGRVCPHPCEDECRRKIVDEEIFLIEKMGVEIIPNTKIGVDIPFETIRAEYDAVLLGIGAWVSTGVGCKGEDLPGVIGGIDFLRKVVRNEEIKLGDNVAIVGGGNTAMDACRTAVRLGAKKVYNIYRRTKDEMPADQVEICLLYTSPSPRD